MKKVVYFEVVDQRTGDAFWERYATEEEAWMEAVEAIGEGDYPNPLYIRKTVCTVNAKGKTTRKDSCNIGLV